MKTDNSRKPDLQGLIKLMVESIEAFGANGRVKGAIKKSREELAKLSAGVPNRTELCEMGKIVDTAIKTNTVLDNLKTSEAELVKLSVAAQEKRKVFDKALNKAIGDVNTEQGKETAKQWGFLVQKTVVLGLGKLNANAYRYVDPRSADSLRLSGEAYVQAHNALGKTVKWALNPRSAQEMDAELVKGLADAEAELNADKVLEIRKAQEDLRKHCGHLLKMKVGKPDAIRRSAAVQSKQAALSKGRVKQSGSVIENTAVTMGQANGSQPLPAPRKKGPAFTSPRNGGEAKK